MGAEAVAEIVIIVVIGVLSMEIPPGVAGGYEVIVAIVPTGKSPTIANAQGPGGRLATVSFSVLE